MFKKTVDFIPGFTGIKSGALCFKTTLEPSQPLEPWFVDDLPWGSSALKNFHERLVMGESFPAQMIVREVSVDTAFAMLLYRKPQLALLPRTASWVHMLDLQLRLGSAGSALLTYEDQELLSEVRGMIPEMIQTSVQALEVLKEIGLVIEKDIRLDHILHDTAYENEKGFAKCVGEALVLEDVYAQGYIGGMFTGKSGTIVFKKSSLILEPEFRSLVQFFPRDKTFWHLLDNDTMIVSRGVLTEEENECIWETLLNSIS